jgi:hypothetical protein
MGNPAKQVGWACRCGERLNRDLNCLACGKQFMKNDNGIQEVKVKSDRGVDQKGEKRMLSE